MKKSSRPPTKGVDLGLFLENPLISRTLNSLDILSRKKNAPRNGNEISVVMMR
ncbi:hypothetical protein BSLA_02f2440 [Burkholderia stabilis]|nr:hypothetical protein BSLA_02f2440 [Burkholderia stabilis]